MKLYNKSKDYIKNKYITQVRNTAVLFKLFHWGGGHTMSKSKKAEHKRV